MKYVVLMVFALLTLLTSQSHAKCRNDCYYWSSENYRGTVSTTVGGLTCQRWDSQTPHKHSYTSPSQFIDNALPENFCRNVIGQNYKPWCYTTDKEEIWDYCRVSECNGRDCYDGSSENYNGTVSKTVGGFWCQRWDSQTPHKHDYTSPSQFIDGALPENYCRNAIGENYEPWCYTSDVDKRWEYCPVSEC